jgi:enterochelin esterase-like enzyme
MVRIEKQMNTRSRPTAKLRAAFQYLSAASLLAAAATARSQSLDQKPSYKERVGIRFQDFLTRTLAESDSAKRQAIVEDFILRVRAYGSALTEDSAVYFLYQGKAKRVQLAGDINGWKPAAEDLFTRIPQTDLSYLNKTLHPAARFEYKLIVDSSWTTDQLNGRIAIGGYGPNSEIWMPKYRPPETISYRPDISHGRLDTLIIQSKLLNRGHSVFVYLPPGYRVSARKRYQTIFVTDGGEYITLAQMPNVLDNLISEKRIRPIIAVFVDPRTDINDSQTSKRMVDYSMSDTFVSFMIKEVRGRLTKKYAITTEASETAIMGASLGGLISTYAAYTRPDVFGLCAAQSPSYWWKNKAMIRKIEAGPKKNVKFYIDTGTIRDAQEEASEMRDLLKRKGYRIHYEEHPEGHNWVNWRARISSILEYFWGKR